MIRKNFLGRALLTCTLAGGLVMAVGTTPIHAAGTTTTGAFTRLIADHGPASYRPTRVLLDVPPAAGT